MIIEHLRHVRSHNAAARSWQCSSAVPVLEANTGPVAHPHLLGTACGPSAPHNRHTGLIWAPVAELVRQP